ncbi:tetratricopeptide tpr-1 repeat-containing protein [Leptolyngbya sp. Heron Island J]|uniref:CHAT domain-containing tetratricopeptide repeat protein n=1 Tax=Leptolyngbya sp. Heron Island J TaxID=1385935 RepID=UPI0003B955F0|nr:tetratricopeptide repeat protein [Leptolyngbya sp. Heron Island J]ESA37565.1 tetratricopeptide tpr-1 repeat-containing protein [Leptolyngbya sp. Heron Island J]
MSMHYCFWIRIGLKGSVGLGLLALALPSLASQGDNSALLPQQVAAIATTAVDNQSHFLQLAQIGNTSDADRLFQQGMQLYREGSVESLWQAIQVWQQADQEYQQAGNQVGQANTLTGIGFIYSDLGDKQQALSYYNQALLLWRATRDRAGEANTLNNIGFVYSDLGDKQQALDYYNQALPLWRVEGNQVGEATTLNNIGTVYDDLGDKQQALNYYNQALTLRRDTRDRAGEASTLNNIGTVYDDLGDKQQALNYFNKALLLWRAISDRAGEASTLNNIGAVYDDLGDKQQALDYYNQALTLSRAVSDRAGEARTLHNIGLVHRTLGKQQQALNYYNQALILMRAVGNWAGAGITLSNIGAVYSTLREPQQALDYYYQALPLMRTAGDRGGEANTLNNIGFIYDGFGAKQQALDSYNQALLLMRAVDDRRGEAVTLNNIGAVYQDLRDEQQALGYHNQALTLRRAVGDRRGEAVTLRNVARLHREQGNLSLALENIDQAIDLIEELRATFSNAELQTTYFSTVQGYYQFKIDILMELGETEAAFNTSEAARARTLLELLNEAQVNIRQGVEPTLLEEEQALQRQLQNLESRRVALVKQDYTETDLQALDQESDAVLQKLEQKLAQIRQVSPAYAELKAPKPLTLDEIRQQVLDSDTVLLQYALGNDQSYLWIIGTGADEFETYILPGRDELTANNGVAKRFRKAVSTPGAIGLGRRVKQSGKALQAVILPERPEWMAGKRLLIAGDGILNQIPFAALPVPNRSDYTPLLREHEILSQPSASAIAILRQELGDRPPAPKALAVLADPIYSTEDARLTGEVIAETPPTTDNVPVLVASNLRSLALDNVQRLPHTRQEADRILALVPDEADTNAVFDLSADYNWATNPELEQYRMVHLATHGFVNEVNPQLSGLVLAMVNGNGETRNDSFLRLHDIFNLRLNAELVVLSACQTGRGTEVSGEGIVGISRGFMYAGAERLLVSLWNIDDEKTAELMEKVYRYILEDSLSPAAALQAAQRDMLNAEESPFFWAAFTPQGEWQ